MRDEHLPKDIDHVSEEKGAKEIDVQPDSVLAPQRPGKQRMF